LSPTRGRERARGGRELERALAELASTDWRRAEEAIEAVGDRLGALSERDAARATKKLLALAHHPKWEVRRTLARVALNVHGEPVQGVLAALAQDENSWVRDAARRTLARRTELARTDILKEQHEDLLVRWLADLEARHGARVRESARKVATKYAELLVREAYHEAVKAIAPLDLSLTNLEIALDQEQVERAVCRKHVSRARDRLRLLNALLSSLRDLTTEVTPDFHEERLRDVVTEALALVRDRNRKKFQCELVVAKGLVVEVHRVRALQVFTNILQNALESYDEEWRRRPWIRIEAVVEGPRVVLSFADRGCGMSEEALKDVFKLFASKKPDGLGFGLALVRKIVETEHRGSIRIASKAGEGTTVTVAFPLAQEPT
jgi:signal transduction histidine kinase